MSQNSSNSGLLGFFQRISGWITAVIGLLTSLFGFIKLVQGDTGLATIVLLTFGIVVLWLTCAYFYWKPAPKVRTAGFTPPISSKQRKRVRRLALVGMFTIPILTATGFHAYQYLQSLPTKDIIVLIAEFKSLQPEENYAVTEPIIKQLRQATRKYSDVKIQPLKKPITEQEGSEVARKEGNKSKASIVIWGWYGTKGEKVPVSANFEVLRPPEELPELGQQMQTPAVAELKSFKLQTRLSNEMAYLSLFTLGMTRYTASDWDGAIARFTDALSQTTERTSILDRSIVYFYRGYAYGRKGDYDRALADYNQAIKLQPNLAQAYNNRALVYLIKGDYNRALADYNQTLKLQPNRAMVIANRGLTYTYKGDYNRAIADFNQALKLQPDLALALNSRGLTYIYKGDYNRAITDFNQALKLQPNLAMVVANRGVAYLSKGEYDRAVADSNKALEIQPNLVIAYANRGASYAYKQEFDRAIADLTYVLKLQPNFAGAYANRSVAYIGKGEFDRAIADANQALKLKDKPLEPDLNRINADIAIRYNFVVNPEVLAYNNRGLAYLSKGDYNRALVDINQALKLQPNLFQGYFSRALIYREKGEYDRAIADLNQAIKLQPKNAILYRERGHIYAQKDEYNSAIADLNQAIKLDSKNAGGYNARGWYYAQTGEYDRALADVNQAIKLKPEATFYDTRGFAYAGKADYDRALADYNQALKLDSKADYIYHHRGIVYRNQGKRNQAIADFKKALELTKDSKRRQDTEKQLQELGVK